MQSSPRRFHLRERTSLSHSLVDDAVGSLGSIRGYADYLVGLHAFRSSVETVLAGIDWPKAFGHWRPQAITALIADDMSDLRLAVVTPPPLHLKLGDPSRLLGAIYVLEGSALGARVLYKRAQALGLTEEFGARHLARQSDGVESWRAFLALLDRQTRFDMDAAADGANAVFQLAGHAFAGVRCHAE